MMQIVEEEVPLDPQTRNLDEEQEFLDYEMLSQQFDYNSICETDDFVHKRTKNTLYKGLVVEKKRHGLGVLIY